jgi:hypothetical protein
VGKEVKYSFAFYVVGDTGGKETLDSFLNMKYFIHAVKFWWSIQILLWPLIFHHSPVAL